MRLAILMMLLAPSASVVAQDVIQKGTELLREAEFEQAIVTLTRAESQSVLPRHILVELYGHRALAHHAMGDEPSARMDLTRALSLEPAYEVPALAPPRFRDLLTDVLARHPGRLGIEVTHERTTSGIRFSVSVRNDPGDVVREVRLSGGAGISAPFVDGGDGLTIDAVTGDRIRYFARGIAAGGGVVASIGSATSPESFDVPPAEAFADPPSHRRLVWPWVVGGVGAAALATGLTVFLLTRGGGSPEFTVDMPDIRWP